jgi:RNA polymerase sigma-70 factor (ECF subfamily)
LYNTLQQIWPSPVVALNRIAARAMVDGPQVALAELAELEGDERLASYHYLPAIKADLLRRLGRSQEAERSYRAALDLATNAAEQAFLRKRLAEVTLNA